MTIAKQHETDKMLAKNLSLLPQWIREIVSRIDDEELNQRVKVSYNAEGLPVCSYIDHQGSFRITGASPIHEAEQWGKGIDTKGAGGIFMFGSGFGYPIFELFRKKQPHTLIVLFEQNIYLFKSMLCHFDFEPLISTNKLVFLIGDEEQFSAAFNHLFYSIAFASCTAPAFAFTHAANRNFKSQYKVIHRFIFSQLSLFVFYIGNDHQDNLIGFRNLIANAGEIVKNPSISSIKSKYKDVPAFIIANGPSLDRNIKELAAIGSKGLIISTESAIVPLLRNKIKPDILTIIERTKYTYFYHFEGIEYPEDMALICLGLVDKRVFPAFPGEKIPVFRNLEAINQWINKFLGDGSAVDAGANVSHLAFEIAVLMGADPIVFVGQDFAYGAEGVTHSKDAVYQEDKGKLARDIIQAMQVVSVEGNDGSMIPSNQMWLDFKTGLEQKLASHPEKTIINATEGGAKITGAECEPLKAVIEKYCVKKVPKPVHRLIAENRALVPIAQKREGLKMLIEDIRNYIILFRKLSRITLEGKLTCRNMVQMTAEKKLDEIYSVLEEAYNKNIETFQMFIQDDLTRCFSQQVIFAYYYLMNRLGLIDTQEKMKEIFRIQHDFFLNLNLVYQSVAVHLENAEKSLEDIMGEFDDSGQRSGHDEQH
jgi:Uncharacterized protein conserved in bacteria